MRKKARTHVRNTTSVGPEESTCTPKEADMRCDMDLYDVSCAPSNFQNFLCIRRTSGPHV